MSTLMTTLFGGAVGFALPWLMIALLILPIIWWFLRATPPAPRDQRFPAIRLLLGLRPKETTPQRTPWWLLLLRLAIAALLIIAFAGPILDPVRDGGQGPLTVVVDDGWAAAQRWDDRQTQLTNILGQAQRSGRPVTAIVTTETTSDAAQLGPASASEIRRLLDERAPRALTVDRSTAATLLSSQTEDNRGEIIWLSNGLSAPGDDAFTAALEGRPLSILLDRSDAEDRTPVRLLADEEGSRASRALLFTAERSDDRLTRSVRALGKDSEGRLVAEVAALLEPGVSSAQLTFDLPRELRNRLERVELEGIDSAGTVQLLDESFRRRAIGIVSDGADQSANRLLTASYYLTVALERFADVEVTDVSALIDGGRSIIFWPDTALLNQNDRDRLQAWVNEGGTLVRFAGPNLAADTADPRAIPDQLLPVPLRPGDRSRGGAMNWGEPARLGYIPENSPLNDLNLSADVSVSRQVLAQPSPTLEDFSWLTLEDGTPLVTGRTVGNPTIGAGRLVLVHTSAGPRWSSLALSGFYVELLRKLVATSNVSEGTAQNLRPLPPRYVLNGFGRRIAPGADVLPLSPDSDGSVTAANPPGVYGTDSEARVINLSKPDLRFEALSPAPGWTIGGYDGNQERDLKAWFLIAALILFMLDLIARTRMAGGSRLKLAATASLLLGVFAALPLPEARADDARDALAILDTRLAFIRTGNAKIDATSRAGLFGLTNYITRRSSIDLELPAGINLDEDPLIFHPLIYWPLQEGQGGLPTEQVAKINDYLNAGGMLIIDSRDGGIGSSLTDGRRSNRTLTRALRGINVPRLQPVPDSHVLTKSFYLLDRFPGRWAGGSVWVAADSGDAAAGVVNDGVSPIILGNADWAAAWAVAEDGSALFPTIPGTDRQREFAFRFGMNTVMYALAGNYKADQVHSKAIVERLSGEAAGRPDTTIPREFLLEQLRPQLAPQRLPDALIPLQPRPNEQGD